MITKSPRSGHCIHIAKIIQLILFDLKNKNAKIIWLNGAAKFDIGKDTVCKTLRLIRRVAAADVGAQAPTRPSTVVEFKKYLYICIATKTFSESICSPLAINVLAKLGEFYHFQWCKVKLLPKSWC